MSSNLLFEYFDFLQMFDVKYFPVTHPIPWTKSEMCGLTQINRAEPLILAYRKWNMEGWQKMDG